MISFKDYLLEFNFFRKPPPRAVGKNGKLQLTDQEKLTIQKRKLEKSNLTLKMKPVQARIKQINFQIKSIQAKTKGPGTP